MNVKWIMQILVLYFIIPIAFKKNNFKLGYIMNKKCKLTEKCSERQDNKHCI